MTRVQVQRKNQESESSKSGLESNPALFKSNSIIYKSTYIIARKTDVQQQLQVNKFVNIVEWSHTTFFDFFVDSFNLAKMPNRIMIGTDFFI